MRVRGRMEEEGVKGRKINCFFKGAFDPSNATFVDSVLTQIEKVTNFPAGVPTSFFPSGQQWYEKGRYGVGEGIVYVYIYFILFHNTKLVKIIGTVSLNLVSSSQQFYH